MNYRRAFKLSILVNQHLIRHGRTIREKSSPFGVHPTILAPRLRVFRVDARIVLMSEEES